MPMKYGSRKTKCSWAQHPHPSALEASVCDQHHLLEVAGQITEFKWIASVQLTRRVKWKVDFSYWDVVRAKRVWVEAKGAEDLGYKVKKTLWSEGFGPGELQIWKGNYLRPKLVEVIIPESGDKDDKKDSGNR